MKSANTKEHIATTLMESVTEIPLKKMSVHTLCQRAETNRGVFYYHFRDIHDLVCWVYHNEITLPTQELIAKDGRDVEKIIAFSLELLYANREFYVQAFQAEGEHSLGDYAKKEIEDRFRQIWQVYLANRHRRPKEDGRIEKIIAYFSNAHYYTLLSWIRNGMDLPPEEMAEILSTVSRDAIRYTLEQATEPR